MSWAIILFVSLVYYLCSRDNIREKSTVTRRDQSTPEERARIAEVAIRMGFWFLVIFFGVFILLCYMDCWCIGIFCWYLPITIFLLLTTIMTLILPRSE